MDLKVILSREDKGYSVSCPALPGCHSQGETREEALKNIREAIDIYIETLNSRAKTTSRIEVTNLAV